MLAPQAVVGEAEREAGLARLVYEAAFSSATTALTSGVILTALALHLHASNLAVGLLASLPFLAQLLQVPAVVLIDRWRRRKAMAVVTSVVRRTMLALMAATVLMPPATGVVVLIAAQAVLCGLGAFGSCAWNAWVRDLAPEERLGTLFARRTAYATGVSLIVGLAAAAAVDRPDAASRGSAFLILYAVGCVTGLVSGAIVARMPEPAMPPPTAHERLWQLLKRPFADPNFRRLLRFVASWQFAVNLATPFFTVFIVRQLGLGMTWVMLLSVVSQIANLALLRTWGLLSDRYANKSVLAIAAPAYIAAIVAMVAAPTIAPREWLIAYLVVLHALMGASVAGVTLSIANIALKLSPRGDASAYVAANALATAVSAGLAPVLGGLFADFFARRRFELELRWISPEGAQVLQPLTLTGWTFYFLIAGAIGLYALHRLAFVEERGEVRRGEIVQQLLHQTRRSVRNVSSVAGLRALTELPTNLLRPRRRRMRSAGHP